MLRFQPAHGDGLALLGKDSEPADEGQFLDSAQTVQYVVFEPDGGRLVPVVNNGLKLSQKLRTGIEPPR